MLKKVKKMFKKCHMLSTFPKLVHTGCEHIIVSLQFLALTAITTATIIYIYFDMNSAVHIIMYHIIITIFYRTKFLERLVQQ